MNYNCFSVQVQNTQNGKGLADSGRKKNYIRPVLQEELKNNLILTNYCVSNIMNTLYSNYSSEWMNFKILLFS